MCRALNRLEEAVDQAEKAAKYQYNGLGHRGGKLEGSPIRIEDDTGRTRESYGYGAFGEDLYGNQGERCSPLGIRDTRWTQWLGLTMHRRGSISQVLGNLTVKI